MLAKFGWTVAALSLLVAFAGAIIAHKGAPAPAPPDKPVVLQARAAFAEENWAASEAKFRQAIAENPEDPGAWFELGLSLHFQARYQEARHSFRTAGEKGKDLGLVHYNIACGYARLRQNDQALQHLRLAVENGFCGANTATQDPDLAPLRQTPEFQDAVAQMRRQCR